jgi:hypothetical protein
VTEGRTPSPAQRGKPRPRSKLAVDGSDGFLYMYGPDATKLFHAIESTLRATPFMKGAGIKLRFGRAKVGVKETTLKL